MRVEVCAPSSERCRLYTVGRASRPSAAPIPPPMTTWWWVGHRQPAPKRRSGPRLVSPGARHARGGGRPPHRRPRGGGVHPDGFFIQEQFLHRIRRRPTELCLQCSDTDCPAGRGVHGLRRRRRTPQPTCCWSVPACTDRHSVCWEISWQWRETSAMTTWWRPSPSATQPTRAAIQRLPHRPVGDGGEQQQQQHPARDRVTVVGQQRGGRRLAGPAGVTCDGVGRGRLNKGQLISATYS